MKKLLMILLVLSTPLAVARHRAGTTKNVYSSTPPSTAHPRRRMASQPLVTPTGENKHEILLAYTAADFQIGNSTSIQFNLGYHYTLMPNFLQVGIVSELTHMGVGNGTGSSGVGLTVYQLVIGPTLNAPMPGQDLRNALFFSAMAGVATGGVGGAISNVTISYPVLGGTQFKLVVTAGKRFQLLENVLYRPSVGLEMIGSNVYFNAQLLSASIMF